MSFAKEIIAAYLIHKGMEMQTKAVFEKELKKRATESKSLADAVKQGRANAERSR